MKSVVITGGNRGIGLGITEAFVDADYHVVVAARQELGISKRFGKRVTFVSTDVRKPAAHVAAVKAAIDQTGTLSCFINNAGFSAWKPIEEIDEQFLGDVLETNLHGAFWGCKAAVSAMKSGGSIVNISSIASKRGSANNSAYCASKFGMNGLTQALAKEVGGRGIRVNAICPVLIATDGLVEALKGEYAPARDGDVEGFLSKFTADNAALKRLPKASEVGAMCVFLASDAASAITAQCINIDCGVFPQ